MATPPREAGARHASEFAMRIVGDATKRAG
jgi:hypothetical protein